YVLHELSDDPGRCIGLNNAFLDIDGDGAANVLRHDVEARAWHYLLLTDTGGEWLPIPMLPTYTLNLPDIDVTSVFGVDLGIDLPNEVYFGTPAVGSDDEREPLSLRVASVNGDRLMDFFE